MQLTIDPQAQQAADDRARRASRNRRRSSRSTRRTGQLRAVVSKPDGGFDRALEGTYPPGSTFKVVTSAALLANGNTASTPAPCPPTITVNGRTFHNFEGEASGSLDLARAFAISCNNAFIGLGDKLPADALGQAAASFGFNADWSLPITRRGRFVPDADATAPSARPPRSVRRRVLASPRRWRRSRPRSRPGAGTRRR